MKRRLTALGIMLVLVMAGCGAGPKPLLTSSDTNTEAKEQAVQISETTVTEDETGIILEQKTMQENKEQSGSNMIKLTVGESVIHAKLEENASAEELAALLKNGAITMSASNYGGFEKVCALGTSLTRDDAQITTQAGDIMLYSGNQIVIFYAPNSWAYTRLAKVVEEDIPKLRTLLSGNETEVTMELEVSNFGS